MRIVIFMIGCVSDWMSIREWFDDYRFDVLYWLGVPLLLLGMIELVCALVWAVYVMGLISLKCGNIL